MEARKGFVTGPADQALRTFSRFPWPLTASLIGTASAIAVSHGDPWLAWGVGKAHLVKLQMVAFLGIGLFYALAMLGERWRAAGRSRPFLQAGGAALLGVYYVGMDPHLGPDTWIRYWIFFIAIHLFVAFGPFLRDGRSRSFWRYNQILFLRAALAVLFSGVLYTGLALALAAISGLLGLRIPGRTYGDLAYLIAGIFNTWFFLAGIPHDLDALETLEGYPLTLKVMAQYVLVPLVTLNLIILYAFAAKALLEMLRSGIWPQPWIAYPLLAESLAGILSLLLLYPLRGDGEAARVRSFRRFFYPAQWPLMLLLAAVLAHDFRAQGVRESGYLSMALALWVFGISVYAFGGGARIKPYPASLFALCMLCSFGPWGVSEVTWRSQVCHLRNLLAAHGMFQDGKIVRVSRKADLSPQDKWAISGIAYYLWDRRGLEKIGFVLPADADSAANPLRSVFDFMVYLGLENDLAGSESATAILPEPDSSETCEGYLFGPDFGHGMVPIRGFDFIAMDVGLSGCDNDNSAFSHDVLGPAEGDTVSQLSLSIKCRENRVEIRSHGHGPILIALGPILDTLERFGKSQTGCRSYTGQNFPRGELLLTGENGEWRAGLRVRSLNWEKRNAVRQVKNLDFDLLMASKPHEPGAPPIP